MVESCFHAGFGRAGPVRDSAPRFGAIVRRDHDSFCSSRRDGRARVHHRPPLRDLKIERHCGRGLGDGE
jgi:hypothetical protein